MLRYVMAMAGVLALGSAALAEQVELVTGELLRGPVVAQEQQTITLAHPVLGKLVIRREQVARVSPDAAATQPATGLTPAASAASGVASSAPTTQAAVMAGPASAPATAPALPVKPLLDPERWINRLSIGVSGTRNVTEALGVNVAIKSQRTTRLDRWTFESAFYYSETDDTTTRNEFVTRTLKDWLIPDSKWFVFGQGEFDLAQLRPYDERLSGSAGPGYQLLKNEKVDLRLRLGAGGYQQWGSDDDEFHPETSLGTELEWRLNKKQTLIFANTFFADMGILGRNRNVTSADWIIRLQETPGLSLKFSLRNEYDSFTADDAAQNDLHFSGGLQFEF
ncbi:MAG: DUF481 domain-containing protein [Planctomycetota bacterium]|nr:DUF481 domain-containing protein [Planctomycetota bacterium]